METKECFELKKDLKTAQSLKERFQGYGNEEMVKNAENQIKKIEQQIIDKGCSKSTSLKKSTPIKQKIRK